MQISTRERIKAREELARKRLISVLGRHRAATRRTLEQKISDAGPFGQRIDPHVLSNALRLLLQEGIVQQVNFENTPWFFMANTPWPTVEKRIKEQAAILRALGEGNRPHRIGQCLEIAVYRALLNQDVLTFSGAFRDLEEHDDSRLYPKDEPPSSLNGKILPRQQKLDFLVFHPEAGPAAIEVKNIRQWLYPGDDEILKALKKAVTLDCVPVFVLRRHQYLMFSNLSVCGVILHQNYNQLLPGASEEDRILAEKAKDKRLLGYHDIRLGNNPDRRLTKFITTDLPQVLPEARQRFDKNKGLMKAYLDGDISPRDFRAHVRQ